MSIVKPPVVAMGSAKRHGNQEKFRPLQKKSFGLLAAQLLTTVDTKKNRVRGGRQTEHISLRERASDTASRDASFVAKYTDSSDSFISRTSATAKVCGT